jgi:hypothetical protein
MGGIVDKGTGSAENDVIDGDEEEFDHVADPSHDRETDGAGGSDLLEFYINRDLPAMSGFSHTSRKRLLAP